MRLFAAAAMIFALALLALALLTVAGRAGEVDFSIVLTDQDGEPLTDCAKADEKNPGLCKQVVPATLGRIVLRALNVPDPALPWMDQVRRGVLAAEIYKGKTLALTDEESALIKTQIAKAGFQPIVVMRAVAIIDPAAVKR